MLTAGPKITKPKREITKKIYVDQEPEGGGGGVI